MKVLLIALTLASFFTACGTTKIVARNCEKTDDSDLYVCEKL